MRFSPGLLEVAAAQRRTNWPGFSACGNGAAELWGRGLALAARPLFSEAAFVLWFVSFASNAWPRSSQAWPKPPRGRSLPEGLERGLQGRGRRRAGGWAEGGGGDEKKRKKSALFPGLRQGCHRNGSDKSRGVSRACVEGGRRGGVSESLSGSAAGKVACEGRAVGKKPSAAGAMAVERPGAPRWRRRRG